MGVGYRPNGANGFDHAVISLIDERVRIPDANAGASKLKALLAAQMRRAKASSSSALRRWTALRAGSLHSWNFGEFPHLDAVVRQMGMALVMRPAFEAVAFGGRRTHLPFTADGPFSLVMDFLLLDSGSTQERRPELGFAEGSS